MSGFGTARLLFCHQNEEPKIFLEVLSATTAFSLIFVSEYMLGSKVLICSSGRPSEAGHDPSINLKTKKRLRYYSLLGKSAKFNYEGIIGNKRSRKLYTSVSCCSIISTKGFAEPPSQIRRAMVCAFCLLGNRGSKICEDIAFRYICTCPTKPQPSEAAVDDVQEKRKSVTILFSPSKSPISNYPGMMTTMLTLCCISLCQGKVIYQYRAWAVVYYLDSGRLAMP